MSARHLAVLVLQRIVKKAQSFDEAWGAESGRMGWLSPADERLARAVVTVTLRHHGVLDHQLGLFLTKPLPSSADFVKMALLSAAAQILFLDVPAFAVVHETVELVGKQSRYAHFKGLVNAVLRRFSSLTPVDLAGDALDHNTPVWLRERWVRRFSEPTARKIAEAHRHEAFLDVSFADAKDPLITSLGGMLLPHGTMRFKDGRALPSLEGFDEGRFWAQDAASRLPVHLLGDVRGLTVLDVCAAPGGKTAQLLAAGAVVTALERSPVRFERLRSNLDRLKMNATLLLADALRYETDQLYDVVLLDAPCSATGTLRRHPDVAFVKSERDIQALARQQAQLLERTARWVKPGGFLIFCTCSLEMEETEDQIQRFLVAAPLFKRVPYSADELSFLPEALTKLGDIQTLPCHFDFEDARLSGVGGFFVSRLQFASVPS